MNKSKKNIFKISAETVETYLNKSEQFFFVCEGNGKFGRESRNIPKINLDGRNIELSGRECQSINRAPRNGDGNNYSRFLRQKMFRPHFQEKNVVHARKV